MAMARANATDHVKVGKLNHRKKVLEWVDVLLRGNSLEAYGCTLLLTFLMKPVLRLRLI